MNKHAVKIKNRNYYLKKRRNENSVVSSKQLIKLPDIYKKLTLSEFMVYCAVKDCVEIFGVEQLAENTCLSERSIRDSVKRLNEMQLINVVKIGKSKLLTIKR